MPTVPGKFISTLSIVLIALPSLAEADDGRWWPIQAMPKALVRTTDYNKLPAPHKANQMMLQSVAGLAALAVNEGHGDEMVWIGTQNVDMENWYARLLSGEQRRDTHGKFAPWNWVKDWCARLFRREPRLEVRGTFAPWDLVDRYVQRGVIKGYILYSFDESEGEIYRPRPGVDCSANVATSLAGLLHGIIVDERLEKEAKAHGLKLLLDVRLKTQQWCFDTYKDQFNRHMLCTQDPRLFLIRDLAIAQRAFTVFGDDAPTPAVMAWLAPLSPILGWNGGDEFKTTRLSSVHGHIQTASNWCHNLPVLMAATETAKLPRFKNFDPQKIDWNDSRSAVSFISTDGDNVQWFEASFFRNKNYWSSPDRGRIPFGWSCCFSELAQLCPEALDYALATQTPNDWFIEWSGGYYYPDLFGLERPNRWELLAQHARRTWALMQKNNTRIIGFNVSKFNSPDALKAYEVFAGQTDGLLAILIFQYNPYEAGAGKIFWVKDRKGRDVPVITARYSIWNHLNRRERSGTPAKIAREIRQSVENVPADELPRYDWVITHVWSYFKKAPGTDENAEDMPQEDAAAQGGARGYTPVTWCAERLPSSIRVVSTEELIWRIRMKHNPEQTKQFIKLLKTQNE